MKRVFSGAIWEKRAGYCRALRRGNFIVVSGTTSVKDGKIFSVGDAYAQAKRCFEIIETALVELGATRADVIRTRMYVTDIRRWEEIALAHQEVFGQNPPATSMVEVKALVDSDLLVEVEADALLA